MSEKNYPAIPDPEGVERVYGCLLYTSRHNSQIGRGKSLRIEIVTDAQLALVVLSPTARSVELSDSLQVVDQTAVSAVDQTLEVLQVAVVHRGNIRALVSSQGLVCLLYTSRCV